MAKAKASSRHFRQSYVITALAVVAVISLLLTAAFQIVTYAQLQDGDSPSLSTLSSIMDSNTDASPAVDHVDTEQLVDRSSYQAVFLNNEQVFFGKILDISEDVIVLTSVYYPEQQEHQAEDGSVIAGNIALQKLGNNEFHQPENGLVIERQNIAYWQNLKKDSRVTIGIEQYEKGAAEKTGETGEQGTEENANTSSTSTNANAVDAEENSAVKNTNTNIHTTSPITVSGEDEE